MKNWLILGLVMALAAALAYIFWPRGRDESPLEKVAKENVKVDAEIIARNVDKKGMKHVIIDGAANAITQAGLEAKTDSAGVIDSLTHQLGITRKQLQEYASVASTLRAENLALKESDTGYTYRDPYLAIDLHKPNQVHPGLTADVQYNAVLNWSAYWKRRWLLAPKRNYIDFWMSDPRATIQGIKRLRIQADPPSFGIGLDVIGDYSFKYKEFMPGAAVRLRMGRFGVSGGYIYDIDQQRWWPAVRGSYNLIEF